MVDNELNLKNMVEYIKTDILAGRAISIRRIKSYFDRDAITIKQYAQLALLYLNGVLKPAKVKIIEQSEVIEGVSINEIIRSLSIHIDHYFDSKQANNSLSSEIKQRLKDDNVTQCAIQAPSEQVLPSPKDKRLLMLVNAAAHPDNNIVKLRLKRRAPDVIPVSLDDQVFSQTQERDLRTNSSSENSLLDCDTIDVLSLRLLEAHTKKAQALELELDRVKQLQLGYDTAQHTIDIDVQLILKYTDAIYSLQAISSLTNERNALSANKELTDNTATHLLHADFDPNKLQASWQRIIEAYRSEVTRNTDIISNIKAQLKDSSTRLPLTTDTSLPAQSSSPASSTKR